MNDMRLTDVIKRIAANVYESQKPAKLMFGKIVSIDPFRVDIAPKLSLNENAVIIPKHFKERKCTAHFNDETAEITIPATYKENDTVILLRDSGGQRYCMLGVM